MKTKIIAVFAFVCVFYILTRLLTPTDIWQKIRSKYNPTTLLPQQPDEFFLHTLQ